MPKRDESSKATEEERFADTLQRLHESLITTGSTKVRLDQGDSETISERARSVIPVLEMLEQLKAEQEQCDLPLDSPSAALVDRKIPRESMRSENDRLDSWLPDLERLGRFRIIRQLGSGGYGVVVHARDLHLERDVAIKIPRLSTALSSKLRARFIREAKTAASLNHPGIVAVLEANSENGVDYIVSEFVDGADLAVRLSRGERFSVAATADLVAKMADAVHHAHQCEVLHRDLKPSNILLSEASELVPKITDFGLATLIDQHDFTLTGAVVGTPA